MNYKYILALSFFFVFFTSQAQEENIGSVKVKIYPFSAIVKVNGETISSDTMIFLSPGEYRVTAKAFGRKQLDTLIEVKTKQMSYVGGNLEYTEAYLTYLDSMREYRKIRFMKIVLPAATIAGLSLSLKLIQNASDTYYRKALADRNEYMLARSTDEIEEKKNDFESNRRKHRYYNFLKGTTYVAIGGVSAYYVYLLLANKHNQQPQYKELDKKDFSMGLMDPGLGYGLTMELSF